MDFKSVYGSLLEIFPQIDTRILKAVAVEHRKDADEAAAVVLSEIIPSLSPNLSHDGFTQSQNKSKRERKLERELSIAAKLQGCPVASDPKSSACSSSSGTITMSVAPSTGFHVASNSKSSAYPSSSGTIPMSVAPSHNFNASSTGGFHVAPHSKSSAYSSSGTVPSGAFSYKFNAPSTGFHVAPPDSKSSAYSSSSGTIASVVARSHNLKAPCTGFQFTSASKSSAYPSSSGTIPSVVAPSHNVKAPSTGFQFTSGSKSSAYPSSSGTTPMSVAPSLSANAPSTGLVLNKEKLTNSPKNVGRDGFVVPRKEVESFSEKAYGKEQETRKKTTTCSSGTVPTGVAHSHTAPTTVVISNWDEMEEFWNKCAREGKLDKYSAVPCEAQIGLNEPEDDDTASVVSPVTKDHIEPNGLQKLVDSTTPGDNTTNTQQGFVVDETSNGDIEQDAHVLLNDDQSGEMRQETKVDGDSAKLSDDKESSSLEEVDDESDSLFQDEYLRDYCNIDLPNLQELAEEPNQQESAGELTPNVQLATTFTENAVEKLVDSTTAGDNTTNIEEDLCFEVVPASINVVDETSNDDTELDGSLNTSTNGYNVDHLNEIIEEAKNNKKALATAMESVTNLMREVEIQEKDAERTKEEAAKGGLDTLEKVEELKKMLKHAKEANDMHAGEVYGEKSILAMEVKELENRLLCLSEDRNKSLAVLDEMRESLEVRLERAMEMKKMVEEEKKGKEDSALKLLAEQEALMEKVVEESKLLEQEAEENSKLREFLMDRGQIVDSLRGEISVICEDVKQLKEKFEKRVSSLTKSISSSSQISSPRRSPSMSSSLVREDPETLSINKIQETVEDSSMNKEKKEDDDWDIFDKEFDEFVVW